MHRLGMEAFGHRLEAPGSGPEGTPISLSSVPAGNLLTDSEKAHLDELVCSSWQAHREQQLPAVQHFLPVDPPLEYPTMTVTNDEPSSKLVE